MDTFNKQSADQLDFDADFSRWLPDDDVVLIATAVSDNPTELIIEQTQWTDQLVKVWCAGGTNGSKYKITVTAQTAGGRIKEHEFIIRVKDL